MVFFILFPLLEVIGAVCTTKKLFFFRNSCGVVVYPASAPGRGAGEPRGWEMRMGAGWEGELSEILLICAKKRVSARQR